ncbi:MAG TPA: cytochrome c-type biogenesis protein CcmH [Solirubrobacteraceae bacterium]|nr:cytochrome c-type biogenesis protein CcmH [Solirubrobacteraceae bacterium]
MRRPLPFPTAALATVAAVIAAALLAPALAGAATPRASLTDIENDVICVSCHEPLALAQSPQAESERAFIRMLIAQGQTKAQIEQALVAQYGLAVLGRPPAHGFNLTVYILPPALVIAGLALLAFTLPKWRRRARAAAATPLPAGPRLDAADARRLDDDLRRHG